MFAAIRERLGGAWRRLREGNLAKLFVFEFAVVVLGVLVAQGIADWARERDAIADMEDVRAQARRDIALSMTHAEAWNRLLPCFSDRMTGIMQQVGRGDPVTSAQLQRPGVEFSAIETIDPQALRRLEERYGRDSAQRYVSIADANATMIERIDAMVAAWEALALIDPKNGPVGPMDRHDARAAASRIKTLVRGMGFNNDVIRRESARLRIEPTPLANGRYASDCDEMWDAGYMLLIPELVPEKFADPERAGQG